MKISRNWLQTYFEEALPDAAALSEALTFHAFEIDGVDLVKPQSGHGASDEVLDVKVTANRGHDCLSHNGIAKELSAILKLPIKDDPFTTNISLEPKTSLVNISIDNPELCPRYSACLIRGVRVGPSPQWLKDFLEAVGQRSINDIVDATNAKMFNLGQPTHAFDASKLTQKDGAWAIQVRAARPEEKILALDEKEYSLGESVLVIADAHTDTAIGIAGVKGGTPASITETTTDVIIESANFNSVSVRKTAQTLKLRTDASSRYEQGISPELTAYGLRAVADLIVELAGGEIVGFVDAYPRPQETQTVQVTLAQINSVLGTVFTIEDVADVFKRLGFSYAQEGKTFTVTPPFERLDIVIPEDLIEEVGRIIGYDKVPTVELSPMSGGVSVNPNFYAAEHIRADLISQGYSEVFTSVFTEKGEHVIANKVDGVRPYLRSNLTDGLAEALKKNIQNKDLLGLKEVKLFEIGTIWHRDTEEIVVATVGEKEQAKQHALTSLSELPTYENLPLSSATRYQSFSKYPFIVRDIAMWVPSGTDTEIILNTIQSQAGDLLVRSALFDQFEKAGKTSYAFRLVFQSFEKTLTDEEVNTIMEKVSTSLVALGFEIR